MNRKRPLIVAAVAVAMLLLLVALAQGKSDGAESQLATVSQIASTGEDVAIPGDGSWTEVSIPITDAPEGAVVTGIKVKYVVANVDAGSVDAELVAGDTGASHALSIGQPTLRAGKSVLTSPDIQAFNGTPVNTTWSLRIRGNGATEGAYVDAFSVKVSFETDMPVPRESGDSQGELMYFRLPSDHPSAPSTDEDGKTP